MIKKPLRSPVNQRKLTVPELNRLAKKLLRQADEHKGNAGKVLLIGGDAGKAGAIILAGLGALYSGAGWTHIAMLDSASAHLIDSYPELMLVDAMRFSPKQILGNINPDVIAIGPGLGFSKTAKNYLRQALSSSQILILDADALQLLANNTGLMSALKARSFPAIITPHAGEAAALLQTDAASIQANRPHALLDLIKLTNAIVVLKGQHTLIGSPTQKMLVCPYGNPGMATAGMGDVLTGCVAALTAQGIQHDLNAWGATILAVYLHALAGDSLAKKGIGPIGMTASELSQEIRTVLNKVISQK